MLDKPISRNSIISRTDGLVSTRVDNDVILMSVDSGQYYGMDAIGSHIWELLGNPARVADIITTMVEEYAVEQERCEKDVITFLEKMYADKVILVEKKKEG